MKRWRILMLVGLTCFLAACNGDDETKLIGKWMGTESSGSGGTVTFDDNETVLVEMGVFNNSFEWAVEDDTLKLYVTDDGKKQLEYEYEIEEKSANDITLYELDEDGKRVEGATIKLSK